MTPNHVDSIAAPGVSRIACPSCGAQCIEREVNCWQCGSLLRPPAPKPEAPPAAEETPRADPVPQKRSMWGRRKHAPPAKVFTSDELIKFDGLTASDLAPVEQPETQPEPEPTAAPETRTMTTLTGEIVEVPVQEPTPSVNGKPAATIGATKVAAAPQEPVFIQSFCSNCGYQNEEGIRECAKCKCMLTVMDAPPPDIEPLSRAWGFDALGAAWIVLGFAAIYCGWFLLKSNPDQHKASVADYLATGFVACAPGILIFLRHMFCKLLFWVMSFASGLVWIVIGTVWILGHLQVSDNGQIGLIWFAVFSVLSFISWVTVRLNDAFDYTFDFHAQQ